MAHSLNLHGFEKMYSNENDSGKGQFEILCLINNNQTAISTKTSFSQFMQTSKSLDICAS